MATLELIDIAKRFGKDVWAVKEMSIEVEDKEFLVLLGPSGCGKTTTMRMVAGLEDVTRGTILLKGRDITDVAPRHRHVSMVFQNYAVWPHMTVYENIAFALKLRRTPSAEINITVKETANMVKIGGLLDRHPGQLSGGQQQRVAVARALAVRPDLFLFDEPLSNLDAKLRVIMRTEMKDIHQKTGATSIFVTHDQSEAMSMADRIVIMKDGEIVQIGTPDDVYSRSADMFVAGFIGTPPTNFFSVTCSYNDQTIELKHSNFRLQLDSSEFAELREFNGSELVLGIRAEDLKVVPENQAVLKAEILVIEPQGSHQIVAFSLEGGMYKMSVPVSMDLHVGGNIGLAFDMDRLSFFNKGTEKRIALKKRVSV